MLSLLCFLLRLLGSPLKPNSRLETENAALRHQLIVLQRKVRRRVQFTSSDRWFFIQLNRWFPSILRSMTIIRPDTLVRWHRAGFRRYWRWKSRKPGGLPQINADLRAVIRRMSAENSLWDAPRIYGELLKLGFVVAQSTVAKYMAKKCEPSGQSWGTFLRNHAPNIAAVDLFVVPTRLRPALNAETLSGSTSRQTQPQNGLHAKVTEAFPWNEAPRYLIRDRDRVYSAAVTHRLRAMGIRLRQGRLGRTALPKG